MNCSKTNTYRKNYEVSDDEITFSTIGPKPWHSIFATQVDILPLTSYNQPQYLGQAIDRIPCQFPCL